MNSKSVDHYLPNKDNAHIDTSKFESEINTLYKSLTNDNVNENSHWDNTYKLILNRISSELTEPHNDELICRYFTPAKFIWFANKNLVYFSSATNFEDKQDSEIPLDYKHSVQKILLQKDILPIFWDEHLDRMRAHWLISCWTSLDNHYDDYLLWHRYAESNLGVGVVTTYGELKSALDESCTNNTDVNTFKSGYVNYSNSLHLPPFNKRNIFRNEKEVRFVCNTDLLASHSVDISSLKSKLSLRFSPDAPLEHIESIMNIWTTMGGSDEYNIAGD